MAAFCIAIDAREWYNTDREVHRVAKALKDWSELDLSDNFIFQKVMRNAALCKELLEGILGIHIRRLTFPETEKQIEVYYRSKGIRLDVYVEDERGVIYNIEMQTTGAAETDELLRRMRYYQASIDMAILDKGEPYKDLPRTYIIFICTFDMFGCGRSKYTFRHTAEEDPTLIADDGTTRIFLSAKGASGDVSQDIARLLRYIDGAPAEGAFVEAVAAEVKKIKEKEEMRGEYMVYSAEIQRTKSESYLEGKLEGRDEERVSSLRNLMENLNLSLDKAMDLLRLPLSERAKYAALLQATS